MALAVSAHFALFALSAASCTKQLTALDDGCAPFCSVSGGDSTPEPFAFCGDQLLQAGEECDDGAANGDERSCTRQCKLNVCGDGLRWRGVEDCDDHNTVTESCPYGALACSVCRADCSFGPGRLASCGDGIVQTSGDEECDDGGAIDSACAYGQLACRFCDDDCRWFQGSIAYCGDGVRQDAEACDNGTYLPLPCDYGESSCDSCDRDCNIVPGAPAYCGDGIITGPVETCDSAGPGCVSCQAQPGWLCNSTCVQKLYRVALVDTAASALFVRDVAASGAPQVIRSESRGSNAASLRPSWSWDGALVAYPVGDYPNETYIYQGTGSAPEVGHFVGTQPSFGYPPLTVVGRQADGFALYTPPSIGWTSGTIPSTQLREPDFEPGSTSRFAFVNVASAANILSLFTGTSIVSIDTGARAFVWHPDGGAIAYVAGTSTCSVKTAVIQGSTVSTPITVATQVPCTAVLAYAPDGAQLAVAAAAELYALDLPTAAPYDLSLDQGLIRTTAGSILDVAYTPDQQFIAYLAYVTGSAGSRRVYLFTPGASSAIDTGLACTCNAFAMSPTIILP